jgi:ankyrin repeat protein
MEMLRTLIALKADVNMAMPNGFSPLMRATFAGNEDVMRFLLRASADPSAKTSDTQQTAADFAMSRGHQKLAAYILDAAQKGGVSPR